MRKVLRITMWIGFILITLLTGSYLWVRTSWSEIITEKQLDQLTSDISDTKPIPQNFKHTLTIIYPDIFETNLNGYAIQQLTTNDEKQICPCRQVAKSLQFDIQKAKKSVGNYYPASLTWAIEEQVSQEQCLAYYISQYSFSENIIGIDNACILFFNEKIDNLNIEQQIELIIRLFYPPLYDKVKRPDLFNAEMSILKEKVTNYNNIYSK